MRCGPWVGAEPGLCPCASRFAGMAHRRGRARVVSRGDARRRGLLRGRWRVVLQHDATACTQPAVVLRTNCELTPQRRHSLGVQQGADAGEAMGLSETRYLTRRCTADGPNAVDDVSFEIREEEISGLMGPKGAGKTTIISMLSTLLRPTAGTATVRAAQGIRWRSLRLCAGRLQASSHCHGGDAGLHSPNGAWGHVRQSVALRGSSAGTRHAVRGSRGLAFPGL